MTKHYSRKKGQHMSEPLSKNSAYWFYGKIFARVVLLSVLYLQKPLGQVGLWRTTAFRVPAMQLNASSSIAEQNSTKRLVSGRSAGGQQALTDHLFQRGDLCLMGVIFSHHGGVASTPTIDEVIEMKRIHDMCSTEHFFMGITWRKGCEPHAGLQFYRWRSDRGDVEPNPRQHDALDFILMNKAVEKEYRLEICFKGAPLRQEKNLSQASQAVVSSES